MAITNREKEGRRKKIEKIRVSKKKKERKKRRDQGIIQGMGEKLHYNFQNQALNTMILMIARL